MKFDAAVGDQFFTIITKHFLKQPFSALFITHFNSRLDWSCLDTELLILHVGGHWPISCSLCFAVGHSSGDCPRSLLNVTSGTALTPNPSPSNHPLFHLRDGFPVSKYWFNKHLNLLLSASGLSPSRLSSHSFHIGAASTAAQSGIPPHIIKILGRWASSAHTSYIRPDQSLILEAQRTMFILHSSKYTTYTGGW